MCAVECLRSEVMCCGSGCSGVGSGQDVNGRGGKSKCPEVPYLLWSITPPPFMTVGEQWYELCILE